MQSLSANLFVSGMALALLYIFQLLSQILICTFEGISEEAGNEMFRLSVWFPGVVPYGQLEAVLLQVCVEVVVVAGAMVVV